jgi:hypothetical protein
MDTTRDVPLSNRTDTQCLPRAVCCTTTPDDHCPSGSRTSTLHPTAAAGSLGSSMPTPGRLRPAPTQCGIRSGRGTLGKIPIPLRAPKHATPQNRGQNNVPLGENMEGYMFPRKTGALPFGSINKDTVPQTDVFFSSPAPELTAPVVSFASLTTHTQPNSPNLHSHVQPSVHAHPGLHHRSLLHSIQRSVRGRLAFSPCGRHAHASAAGGSADEPSVGGAWPCRSRLVPPPAAHPCATPLHTHARA